MRPDAPLTCKWLEASNVSIFPLWWRLEPIRWLWGAGYTACRRWRQRYTACAKWQPKQLMRRAQYDKRAAPVACVDRLTLFWAGLSRTHPPVARIWL